MVVCGRLRRLVFVVWKKGQVGDENWRALEGLVGDRGLEMGEVRMGDVRKEVEWEFEEDEDGEERMADRTVIVKFGG